MRTIKIDGVEIPEDKIREAYEAMQHEAATRRLVKGAAVRVWDDEEDDWYVERLSGYAPHDYFPYQANYDRCRHAAPLDWETIGRTCAPPDAEWFVRDRSRTLIWGHGKEPKPVGAIWRIDNFCKDRWGHIYRVYTHEPADDWKESFRRIERI